MYIIVKYEVFNLGILGNLACAEINVAVHRYTFGRNFERNN